MLAIVRADLVDGHDVRVVEVGGGLGLGAEALHFRLGSETAGKDHLEGDDAVEADLPRLEDDAHAAAGDLFQQLVIAEVAHRPERGGRCQAADAVVVGEESRQLRGQVGVLGQQRGAIRRLTGDLRVEVRGDHRVDGAFPHVRINGLIHVATPVREAVRAVTPGGPGWGLGPSAISLFDKEPVGSATGREKNAAALALVGVSLKVVAERGRPRGSLFVVPPSSRIISQTPLLASEGPQNLYPSTTVNHEGVSPATLLRFEQSLAQCLQPALE